MQMPLISIVIPTTDRLNGLLVCIQSVLDQDYGFIEIVVVGNNCKSTTIVPELLDTFKSDKIKYFYLEICQNANVARNFGAKKAKGEFLAFLDSDDFYLPNHLSNSFSQWINNANDATCVFSNFYINSPSNGHGSLIGEYNGNLMEGIFENKTIDFRSSTLFVKSDYFRQVNFDEQQFKHQDWAFGIAYERKFNLLYLSVPTVVIVEAEGNRMSSRTKPSASIRLYENYLTEPYRKYFIISRLIDELKIGTFSGISEYKKHFDGRINSIVRDVSLVKKIFVRLALSNKFSFAVLSILFRLRSKFK